MVSAPVSRGGGGGGKGEGGRGKGEGGRGKGEGGRGGEGGKGVGGRRRGKGEGRDRTQWTAEEEDIPVSVIPVTVETQHSHVIAKEL